MSASVAGEVWWGGKWVPSCERCAKRLKGVWHETLVDGRCDGCDSEMVSVWTRRER